MYVALYRSSKDSGQMFATAYQDNSLFPPEVSYDNGSWVHYRTHLVAGESQRKNFEKYCNDRNIPTSVDIPH